ncbi:hypothetical protein BGX28_004509 [Mortierella sp. GBA30]|nr:hypothetical protein BGX28_004509 [Mortierella sp. GBA30]
MSAAQDLPLGFILRHSLSEGYIHRDDPELNQLRLSQGTRDSNFENGYDDDVPRRPLSQNPSIYYQKVGLTSTVRANHRVNSSNNNNNKSSSNALNTFNNLHRSSSVKQNGGTGNQRHHRPSSSVSGYGLADFSTSEEEESDSYDESSIGFGSEDEEEAVRSSGVSKTSRSVDPNSPAHYIAHITGRMDPWEMKMQKLQASGKELAPVIADKITNDFNSIVKQPKMDARVSWARENGDIAQKLKTMTLETEAIKERRRKEIEVLNEAMDKEFAGCLARIKDERETAIRIREEAIKKANLEKERLAKEAEDKKKAEIAAKEAREKKAEQEAANRAKKAADAAAAAASNSSATFVSDNAEVEWQHYTNIVKHLREVVKPSIVANRDLKKACFEARREIVPMIGQLFNKREQVMRNAIDIDQVFKKMRQSHGDNAYEWLMNETGKKCLQQIENEALVKSAPAFPVAHVVVLLFTNHPRFLELLMARFVKKCPYVIPKYFPHDPNDTQEAYLKKLGYKRTDAGWEKEDKYNARQCAIFTLYCAIMQTTAIQGQNAYPLSHAWTWMARIMNMPPWPITSSLINVFLEVCGDKYLRTYGAQARKVIQLLMNDFLPLVPEAGKSGTTRLKIQLEQMLKNGWNIDPPEGREFDR